MMYGWGAGNGGAGIFAGILMMVFWVAIIVGIIMLIVWATRQAAGGHVHHTHDAGLGAGAYQAQAPRESALDILDKRYARGEIDKAEYEEKKKVLGG